LALEVSKALGVAQRDGDEPKSVVLEEVAQTLLYRLAGGDFAWDEPASAAADSARGHAASALAQEIAFHAAELAPLLAKAPAALGLGGSQASARLAEALRGDGSAIAPVLASLVATAASGGLTAKRAQHGLADMLEAALTDEKAPF
jgi:hypothetical protein